ncbi:MAG TPA: hypothetical protein VLT16_09795 [Candidatus Limnocylindrales bacterium]|nr:hypothetical protein [Candidatus Limnocylindrales bacterium]
MRNLFLVFQVFAAFFLFLLGLGFLFGRATGESFVGAFLAATGLTFLSLLAVNIKK